MKRSRLGTWGEGVAADYILRKGYRLISRNWRCREGELDLAARRGDTIVFLEVKARRSDRFGPPKAALTPAKQRKLQRAAWAYLEAHNLLDAPWQIDMVAIERAPSGRIERLDHFENAVEAAADL